MFGNIPAELRAYNQWVVWRLEFRPPMLKPTKVPYTPRPNSGKASVIKSNTWGSFEEALAAPIACFEAVDPETPIMDTGFTGIGFVFSKDDPYCGIDLDDVHGDLEAYQNQQQVYMKLNSYTERSPSRNGVHIIVKGNVPTGRRRNSMELYPQGRFFTMTGDVLNPNPIRDAQPELDDLYNKMGGDVKQYVVDADPEQKAEDAAIIKMASEAVNGDKFKQLWEGHWQDLYPTQSEGDFALVDIIAFYTKHIPQIIRLFRTSMLGQRDKAQRDDYVMYMVEKSFDRQLPPIDYAGWVNDAFNSLGEVNGNAAAGTISTSEPGKRPSMESASTATASLVPIGKDGEGRGIVPGTRQLVNQFPSGLLGEVAQFFYDAAPRPSYDVALAGAIAFLSGICGRAYNTSSGAGLNQYILMLAQTGIGKDAVSSGTAKLQQAILPSCPSIIDFRGPGELVSSAGLIKWMANGKPCILSIVGEFGKKMKEMAAPNANTHLIGLQRVLLQMYSKSGHNDIFDPMAYSEREKNTDPIYSPSLTLFGESVPEAFYEALDESMIGDGLLPRFLVFENKSDRRYLNKAAETVYPSLDLITRLSDLAAHCLKVMHQRAVHRVELTPEADALQDEFDVWTTDLINQSNGEVVRQLWNRAHLKALKLASLRAIGENYLNPVVTLEHFMWATDMVCNQTYKLIAKFETGQVGALAATGEGKQLHSVIKAIRELLDDREKYIKYGGRIDMFEKHIITETIISRKLISVACFKNDRMGASYSIKRSIRTLLDADDLREIPGHQMQLDFGSKPKAYVIANPHRFSGDLI